MADISAQGWMLSPAFDINPVTPANGLHLNISDSDNSLSYELAMEVIGFFRFDKEEAGQIKSEVLDSVSHWEPIAKKVGLGRAKRQGMVPVFKILACGVLVSIVWLYLNKRFSNEVMQAIIYCSNCNNKRNLRKLKIIRFANF